MPKTAKPKSPYRGELNKPIYIEPGTMLTGLKSPQEITELANKAVMAKMELLFAHYGIDGKDENSWFRLCVALTREYIEGFEIRFGKPPKAGRPSRWKGTGEGLDLYLRVMKRVWATPKTSQLKAIREVAKEMRVAADTLKRRFEEVKNNHPMLKITEYFAEMRGVEASVLWTEMPADLYGGLVKTLDDSQKKKAVR